MKHTDGKKGFTLIEVIVSIAILGLVSVPLCTSLMKSYEFTMGTNTLLEDHLEATSIVEELMAEGISVTANGTSAGIDVNDISINASESISIGEYSISSTEETTTSTGEDGNEITEEYYSTTITCFYTVTETEITYAYTASFTSTENYSDTDASVVNVYPCTYTDSEDESYNGICFQISKDNRTADNVAIYTYIMNFNCELTAEEDGSVEEDDDVLTLVFAPNFDYPSAISISVTITDAEGSTTTGTYDGAGTFTADADGTQYAVTDIGNGTVTMNGSVYTVTENSDGTTQTWKETDEEASSYWEEASPYWYDVTVAQGNVNINTSIRLATSDDDS